MQCKFILCNISLIIFRVDSELRLLSCSLRGFPLGSSPLQIMSVGGWTVLNYPCVNVCMLLSEGLESLCLVFPGQAPGPPPEPL